MGMKLVTEQEKDSFLENCLQAEKDLENRETKLDKVYSDFEKDIVLVGGSAVEDRL